MAYSTFDSSPSTWKSRIGFGLLLLFFVWILALALAFARDWLTVPVLRVETYVVEVRYGTWLSLLKAPYTAVCVEVEIQPLQRLCERFNGADSPFQKNERVLAEVRLRRDFFFRSFYAVVLSKTPAEGA